VREEKRADIVGNVLLHKNKRTNNFCTIYSTGPEAFFIAIILNK
jgi:hypothetical protein